MRLRAREDCIASKLMFFIPLVTLTAFFLLMQRSLFEFSITSSLAINNVRLICFLTLAIRELLFNRWDVRCLVLFVVAVFVAANAHAGHLYCLADTCMFTFAARNLKIELIMTVSAITLILLMVIVIACSQLNIIPDVIITKGVANDEPCHCLGFRHPNTVGILVFGISSAIMIARGGRMRAIETLAIIGFCLLVYRYTLCRSMLFGVMLVLLLGRVAFAIPARFYESRCAQVFTCTLPAIVAFVAFALVVCYDPSVAWMVKLNDALSWRLSFGHQALESCGLTPFGRVPDFPLFDYLKIEDGQLVPAIGPIPTDCFFVRSFMCAGVLPSVAYLALFTIAFSRSLKTSNPLFVVAFLGILIYSMSENGAMYFYYVPPIMCLSLAFRVSDKQQSPTSGARAIDVS